MVGVIHLDGVESRITQSRYPFVNLGTARMRERNDSAGSMDDSDDVLRWRPRTFNVGWATLSQPLVEGLAHGRDVAGVNHRAGKCWPADRLAGIASRLVDERRHIDRHSQRVQASRYLGNARDTRGPLRRQELPERGFVPVKEVGQHVHVAATVDGGDLDPGNGEHIEASRFDGSFVQAVGRIVVGDGKNPDARRLGMGDERPRGQTSIGRGGMEVKIDHCGCVALGPPKLGTSAGGTPLSRRARGGCP